jgi:hypothetical protein
MRSSKAYPGIKLKRTFLSAFLINNRPKQGAKEGASFHWHRFVEGFDGMERK